MVAYRNGARGAADRRRRRCSIGREYAQRRLSNGKPAVLVIIYRQPGANIIDTVDRVKALIPQLKAAMPPAIDLTLGDRPHHHDPRLAARGRADLADRGRAGRSLVVFVFLRSGRATLVPAWPCRCR